jgi:hypothetical protein
MALAEDCAEHSVARDLLLLRRYVSRHSLLAPPRYPQISTLRYFRLVTGIGTEFLARGEKIEVTRQNSTSELSPEPMERAHRPHTRAFCAHPWRMLQTCDCVAERSEFELSGDFISGQ